MLHRRYYRNQDRQIQGKSVHFRKSGQQRCYCSRVLEVYTAAQPAIRRQDGVEISQENMDMTDQKRKIFLHSCCGPCSTAVIERLIPDYSITVFFYNPNITNEGEYHKRFETEKEFIEAFNKNHPEWTPVELMEGEYDPEEFLRFVRGYEREPENGARCAKCFEFRMERTVRKAAELGYPLFGTTLSVSPHKKTQTINEKGYALSRRYGVDFLDESFKKKDGFRRSVDLSREYGLYRQNYCGCRFSEREGAGPEDPSLERGLDL